MHFNNSRSLCLGDCANDAPYAADADDAGAGADVPGSYFVLTR